MNFTKQKIKSLFNPFAIAIEIAAFAVQMASYWGAKLFQNGIYHYNIESAFDRAFPLIPAFVVIYMGCYFFWILNYFLIANTERLHAKQLFLADFLGKFICFFIFIIFPTTNIRPELSGNGIFEKWLLDVWNADSPYNLFPSAHCFISWICFIGIRKRKEIPLWYQILSCILAILIFISTMATKQHVIWDVLGGMALAELCNLISKVIFKHIGKTTA